MKSRLIPLLNQSKKKYFFFFLIFDDGRFLFMCIFQTCDNCRGFALNFLLDTFFSASAIVNEKKNKKNKIERNSFVIVIIYIYIFLLLSFFLSNFKTA